MGRLHSDGGPAAQAQAPVRRPGRPASQGPGRDQSPATGPPRRRMAAAGGVERACAEQGRADESQRGDSAESGA